LYNEIIKARTKGKIMGNLKDSVKTFWTNKELQLLYKSVYEDGKNFSEIAQLLNKSTDSVKKKFARVDWDLFKQNPETYNGTVSKKWSQEEMLQLDAYLQSGKAYPFIAEKMNRSYTSIERKAQETDWRSWRATIFDHIEEETEDQNSLIEKLTIGLLEYCRYDNERLNHITKEDFLKAVGQEESIFPISFPEIKNKVIEKLDELGLGNPETLSFGEGTYIIVGDSHGKHTKSKTFDMLQHVNKFLKADKIIHVGHILDDDNDISYHWGDFKNVVVVSKIEELKLIQSQRIKFNFSFDIVRGGITLGNLYVTNQELISDYVTTSIRALDSEIFDEQVVVNCHRMETASKCSDGDSHQYFVSPGCLCERHIVKTIKQIDLSDKIVKQAYYGGFSKYRRMEQMNKYWTQGMTIVHVDKNNNHTIVPCIVKKVGNEYAISYFDKIIASDGTHNPNKKILVNADIHSPGQENIALDIQEQICKDYKPDVFVNLGDTHNFYSLNHHKMDKGKVIDGDLMKESAQTYFILERMRKWAPVCHMIVGNHERFSQDFVDKFPQLSSFLDVKFVCGLDELGYNVIDVKNMLEIGSAKFIHGDLMMFGQTGTMLEKASRTYGHDIFVGHIHYPSIRFGGYSVACSANFDQEYNEPNASAWMHGFGMCNQYKGVSFPTTIAITDKKCIIGGKEYKAINPNSWTMKKLKSVKLTYEIE